MAQLIAELDDRIKIMYGQFLLIDLEGADGQMEGALSLEEITDLANKENWFVVTGNLAVVTSRYPEHSAAVRLQLWDGPPSTDLSEWDRSAEASMTFSSARIHLVEVHGHPSYRVFDMQALGQVWHVRACVRALQGAPDSWPPSGIEEYLFQFWN